MPPAHERPAGSPLVSIITPVFNSARFLSQTLASVSEQTYPHIEHILVDGGSTDGTLDLLKSAPNIRWSTGKDDGMYDAVNKGLKTAGGEILAYLNADDLYFPDTVSRVVKFFAEHPTTDLVFSDCLYVDENGDELFLRKYPPYSKQLYAVLDGSTVPQQTCFWRRRVHDKAGYFDSSYKMAGDFDFLVRVGKTCLISKVSGAPLAQFRFHEGMLTLTGKGKNELEIERLHQTYGITPSLWTALVRLLATGRYKARNLHRLRDKIPGMATGRKPKYRP